ncbi:hypothetical protein [Zobellia galactanivorans]|uniref:Hypothetical periplasmic protein n=1 Tax=Zobellia galactanivorans (strain DSM 12802 / CCUG 47099 / CIP 106680 / NCIMB 13871 / Dsij) TaxID=63186 RepID=G0L0X7_ZOBGA|nr:hypothetical protein [Zobellia galactanivorans]CAZ94528.1 Hypothetical periplasmic protein [Zobellia galactanivorans]
MKRILVTSVFLLSLLLMLFSQENTPFSRSTDFELLHQFRAAGIWDACLDLKIDFNEVFGPLTTEVGHPYRRYRWSVSYDENGGTMINALPPEEELGWTPWERWSLINGEPTRTEWVKYPVKKLLKRGIVPWYKLSETSTLSPRFHKKSTQDLESQLRLARVDIASEWLGLDFKKTFIEPMELGLQQKYQQFRWVVIPHILAADGPVIYALPPMHKSDNWPWESWYTDGKTSHIHHVHYTEKKILSTGSWSELVGAPQRPPEVCQFTWYWHNDQLMTPALSHTH